MGETVSTVEYYMKLLDKRDERIAALEAELAVAMKDCGGMCTEMDRLTAELAALRAKLTPTASDRDTMDAIAQHFYDDGQFDRSHCEALIAAHVASRMPQPTQSDRECAEKVYLCEIGPRKSGYVLGTDGAHIIAAHVAPIRAQLDQAVGLLRKTMEVAEEARDFLMIQPQTMNNKRRLKWANDIIYRK